ncbi:unnamed protein product [Orchesella dallaii]|uniref:Uncharacterized protein n=1 Tax=Orchesella dallaii TaxID=48710 RepID=A0ABP1QLN2_9HEXA
MISSSSEQGTAEGSTFRKVKASSEVGRCLLAWKEISNKTDIVWLRIQAERLKFSVHKTKYRELIRQLLQFGASLSNANVLRYKRMYQPIAKKFKRLEYLERFLEKKLKKFKKRERKYERKWVGCVLNVTYDLRLIPMDDLKRNADRDAAKIFEALKILKEQMDTIKIDMNTDIQDCIQRAQDLLNLVEAGGVGENA